MSNLEVKIKEESKVGFTYTIRGGLGVKREGRPVD